MPSPFDSAPRRRRSRRPATCVLAVALVLGTAVAAPRVRAQHVVPTLDVGGVGIRYADTVRTSGATVAPAIEADWDRATVNAAGSFSRLATGWTTNGAVGASLYTPSAGPVVGELAGTAGGSANQDGTRTSQVVGMLRAHLMTAAHGIWLGGGAGRTWDGARWRSTRLGEAGAWGTSGPVSAVATVTPTWVDDSVRYTDAQLTGRVALHALEFDATAGVRAGAPLPAYGGPSRAWGSVTAVAWLTRIAGIVLSAGAYPVDLTQGYPGGRFVSLAVRFGGRDEEPRAAAAPARAIATSALERQIAGARRGGVESFRVASSGGRTRVSIRAPRAARVEIMGDFSAWAPVRLAPAGRGWWTVALPMARGSYQMNLRVDGGRWLVPPGLTAVRDDFGGAIGVLVVE